MTSTVKAPAQPPVGDKATDHPLIAAHFPEQEGRADIRVLWADGYGTRYRVNFYVPDGYSVITRTERMVASYFVIVHDGEVLSRRA